MNAWTNSAVAKRLGLELPIVQGPFGGGLSSVDLVGTVSEAGGLGSFGAHHLSGEEISTVATQIRERTRKPYALNLWIPFEDSDEPDVSDAAFAAYVQNLAPCYAELGVTPPQRPERFMPRYLEQVEAVLAAKPAVFSFVFGIPAAPILEKCRELGIVSVGAATTPDEAIALDRAGVDLIVATGLEAGGHRVSFLRSPEDSLTGTFALIPQVVDAVSRPVIAAGGIADARGIVAALALGAQAVQIGTAFLACRQSNTSQEHRDRLFSVDARNTALTRAYSGRLARGIRNRLMDELTLRQDTLAPYPVQNWLTSRFRAAAIAQGRTDLMSLWASQASPLLRYRDAGELIESLTADVTRLLQTQR